MKRGDYVPDDRELLDTHARALFAHDERSRLLTVNEPGGAGAPAARMFFGRARTCNLWRFRADLPEALVAELEALCADEPVGAELDGAPRHAEEYARLLEGHAPVREMEAGPAYYFAEYAEPSGRLLTVKESDAELLRGGFEDFVDELPAWRPFVALFEGGRAASVCRSVRITGAAHEAGVETLPEFRGRGYAKEVTALWARLVRSAGALPMYSTSWENAASRAVAGKLRLTLYAADFHIT
ncbi:MAG TPA: GNAT family N-acetyltransferase [Pyrinomonadaceae bacterium]|nr:GNAT family N-acetyltransferase [Pyrinomonadaceae bacterium]